MRSGTLRRLVGMGWCLALGVSLHPAHGQTASLVTDLTPGEAAGAGTNPLQLFPAGTHVFFSAEDGPGGSALWVTDGTAAGTQRLPPSESLGPGFLAAVGNLAFFTTGDRLWRTDSTRAGTLALAEVHLGRGRPPRQAPVLHDLQLLVRRHLAATLAIRRHGRRHVHGRSARHAPAGYFWFFTAANVETMLKVIDGRALNGHFWVLFGALSDVLYTVTVTDTATGAAKTYTNPSGQFASIADTSAF